MINKSVIIWWLMAEKLPLHRSQHRSPKEGGPKTQLITVFHCCFPWHMGLLSHRTCRDFYRSHPIPCSHSLISTPLTKKTFPDPSSNRMLPKASISLPTSLSVTCTWKEYKCEDRLIFTPNHNSMTKFLWDRIIMEIKRDALINC